MTQTQLFNLTEAQRNCLSYFARNQENADRNIPDDGSEQWTWRDQLRLTSTGLLEIGPNGWSVPSAAGRAALEGEVEL